MESLLWALDLLVVTFACYWALRADEAESGKPSRKDKRGRR